MPDVKVVVRTLLRIRKARHLAVVRGIKVGGGTPRQHLVRIALMRHIVDDLVRRCVKYRVQGDGRLDHTKVRPDVPADAAGTRDECSAHLCRERTPLLRGIALDVRWAVNLFKIQGESPPKETGGSETC